MVIAREKNASLPREDFAVRIAKLMKNIGWKWKCLLAAALSRCELYAFAMCDALLRLCALSSSPTVTPNYYRALHVNGEM